MVRHTQHAVACQAGCCLPGWSAMASALRASSIAATTLPTSAYGLVRSDSGCRRHASRAFQAMPARGASEWPSFQASLNAGPASPPSACGSEGKPWTPSDPRLRHASEALPPRAAFIRAGSASELATPSPIRPRSDGLGQDWGRPPFEEGNGRDWHMQRKLYAREQAGRRGASLLAER